MSIERIGSARKFSRNFTGCNAGVTLRVSEEPIILGLDTSTAVRSVAIARGDVLLSSVVGDDHNNRSARILCEVDDALHQAGIKIKDVELFAVACGPGNFTGLRSGIALALAFASILKRPVYSIPTLGAVVRAAAVGSSQVCALIPAGRSEVFAQLFRVGDDGSIVAHSEAAHVSPAALFETALSLRGTVEWCGRGADVHARAICEYARAHSVECAEAGELISVGGGRRWVLLRTPNHLAEVVAGLALEEFRGGRMPAIESVRATYVRAAGAELKK